MIEINLVPDIKQELIKAQRIRSTVIAGSIIVGTISIAIVTILAVYVFTAQTFRSGVADGDIKKYSQLLADVPDLSKTLTIQNQLTKINDINNSKKIDSRIFDFLVATNPKAPNNINVSSLTIDSDAGQVTVEGQASNSYAAVEVYKKTIEGAKVKFTDTSDKQQEVTIASYISTSNTSYGEDSSGTKVLRFTISFTYAKELFAPTSKNASIIITTATADGNATDSYLGVPRSIFAPAAKDLKEGQ